MNSWKLAVAGAVTGIVLGVLGFALFAETLALEYFGPVERREGNAHG